MAKKTQPAPAADKSPECPITGKAFASSGNAAFQVKVAPNVVLTCHPFLVENQGRNFKNTELSPEAIDQIRAKVEGK